MFHIGLYTIQNYFAYSSLYPLVIVSTQFLAVTLFSVAPSSDCSVEDYSYENVSADPILNWTISDDAGTNESSTLSFLPSCQSPPLEPLLTINGLILTTFGFYSIGSTVTIIHMTLLTFTHMVLTFIYELSDFFDAINSTMFLAALIIHARETEATGRLDFLWKTQAKSVKFLYFFVL